SISSNLKFAKDVLHLEYTFGEGIENYMNDAPTDVATEPNPGHPIHPVKGKVLPVNGLMAFLDHSWTSKWTTSVGYSELVMENTYPQNPVAFHGGQYARANLFYPPAEQFLYGGKLKWGRRTNFGDGFHSNDYRLQLGVKYNFTGQILGAVK